MGIVVAASSESQQGYMLPATDVFASISIKRATNSKGVQAALPSTEILTAERGHEQVLLCRAAQSGNEAIVRMLLKQPLVETSMHDGAWTKALNLARDGGHEAVVTLLQNANPSNSTLENPLFGTWQASNIQTYPKSLAIMAAGSYHMARRKRAYKPKVRTGCKTCKVSSEVHIATGRAYFLDEPILDFVLIPVNKFPFFCTA